MSAGAQLPNSRSVELFYCPRHGLLSEREADFNLIEGHDGTEFGSTPEGDPYTGEFFCDLPDHREWRCGEKVEQVTVAFSTQQEGDRG